MNPRRLIPYVVVFLVLVGTYVGLQWHRVKTETREQQAKQVFNFKGTEITIISLKRSTGDVDLTRQGAAWEITKPLKAKADPAALENLVKVLAQLKMDRDLGPGDLKTFGLDQPGTVVSFTVKGEQHRLALGSLAPANKGYYARKDEGPNILVISIQSKDVLDQPLTSLRDKTLLASNPDQVKSLKIRTDKTRVELEKTGAAAWRWVGRPDFRVRADRVDQLLREFQTAGISGFPPAPKDLQAVGLAPQAKTEITLVTPQGAETLFLGSGAGQDIYARQGAQGPVVQVNQALPEQLAKSLANLEDRRLWSGSVAEVGKMVWGVPDKKWSAVRGKDFWNLTGPDQAEIKQSAPRLQMALINFQKLEYASLLPQAGAPAKEAFTVEFFDAAGKPMFHLEELGKQGEGGVGVRTKTGDTVVTAVIPQQNFSRWQDEVSRLITPPPTPKK